MLSLIVTLSLGGGRLIYQGWRAPLAHPYTDLHLMWGMIGWVAVLIIGVAWQVVPMFQLTPDYPRLIRRFLVPLLLGGLIVWSVARIGFEAGNSLFVVVIAALLGFAAATLWLQQRRRRRLPDVTLSFWRVAMVSLMAAMVLLLLPGDHALLIGVLLIVGFAMSAVNGMLYKIVPFLIWLHLNNRLQQSGKWLGNVPNMRQILAEAVLRRHYRMHLLVLVTGLAAVIWPMELARAAGAAREGACSGSHHHELDCLTSVCTREYEAALKQLASLRPAVDAFFDAVMVNAEDKQLRLNRLALLRQLSALFLEVADLSQLQG